MKKIMLFTFILIVTSIKLSAQENNYYVKFTTEQIGIAKKISEEKIKNEISFNKGAQYEDKYYWFITTKDEKKYYFSSNKTFTEVIYIEESYNSLMEYIIEKSDF